MPGIQFAAVDQGFQTVDVARQLLAFPLFGCPPFDIGVQIAMFDGTGQFDFSRMYLVFRTGKGLRGLMKRQCVHEAPFLQVR